MKDSGHERRLLHLQGWDGPELEQALAAGPWTRWSPGLCFVVTVLGSALASAPILGALVVTALFGALLPFHPFDLAYNHGIRRLVGRPALPPNRAARRFACALGGMWAAATALAFATGATATGYALGSGLGLAGAVFTFAGLCIPSLLFNLLFGRERACRRSLLAAAINR
jgi:hypothetical protein